MHGETQKTFTWVRTFLDVENLHEGYNTIQRFMIELKEFIAGLYKGLLKSVQSHK